MTLGEFIKQYRAEHDNMSIRSFASLVGMSAQQISNIEKGIGNNGKIMSSTMKTYKKIADAIWMTEQDFLNLLNDNVLINSDYNPQFISDEDIKNLPIVEIDGQTMLNISNMTEWQVKAISLVLQADQESLVSALNELKPNISPVPSQDVQ